MRKLFAILSVTIIMLGFGLSRSQSESAKTDSDASAHLAHQNYVDAINSNNLDSLLGMLTEDCVYLYAGTPVMIGKKDITPWVEGYFKAFKTHYDKTEHEFVVCDEWAFERYSYKSTDTSLSDGSVIKDSGWGLIIYHHDEDGKWRVARDAWGPDHPPME